MSVYLNDGWCLTVFLGQVRVSTYQASLDSIEDVEVSTANTRRIGTYSIYSSTYIMRNRLLIVWSVYSGV